VNKVATVILSFTILIQSFSFDIGDLNKIPVLVDHFMCHIESGDSIDGFFSMHYGAKTVNHQNDHKEHEKLPFKHQHLDSHFQIDYILCEYNNPIELKETILNNNNFTYKEPSSKLFSDNLFQPPQILHS
jgi:hypothetical protein